MWDYICGINSTSDRQMLKVNGMLTQYNGAVVHWYKVDCYGR